MEADTCDVLIGIIFTLLGIASWAMLGKIARLAAKEANEHGLLGMDNISFDGYDEIVVFYFIGPLMLIGIAGMAIIYRIKCIVKPIIIAVVKTSYKFFTDVKKEYDKITQEQKNRWDK